MNWDDIIEEAAAAMPGMQPLRITKDSHAIVGADKPEAWKARSHVFMVADGIDAPRRRRLRQQATPATTSHTTSQQDEGRPTPAEAITKAYKEVGA